MLQNNHLFSRIVVALSLSLFGCTTNNRSSEIKKLVFPAHCENACWIGVEPNVSTVDEALQILESSYGPENVVRDEGAGVITWDTKNANWHGRGLVFYTNNMVDHILVWPSENSIEVKRFVSEIGEPNSVALVVSGPEIKCAAASLVYPQTGLQAYLSPVDKFVGISETQVINGLGIYPPWTSNNEPWTDTATVPWDGYNEYCPEKWPWEE